MSWLLDGNALIAVTISSHPLHLRQKHGWKVWVRHFTPAQ